MLASDRALMTISVPFLLWRRILLDLRRRGRGDGESGAFLLSRENGNRVTTYICYDDLDPDAYQMGGIAFHAPGYAALWQYCKEKQLQVLADVHTHPGEYVRQSCIDQKNPMVPVVGHMAMIVPDFAQRSRWWSLDGVGVYEYLGDFKWQAYGGSNRPRRVRLTLW